MADIVVIDDDPALRGTIRKILERGDHVVREAADGVEGLRLVEEQVPDLVITDLLMPEKEGIETIMELNEKHPAVGIIAISGAVGEDDAGPLVDAELFGASATLPKPFSVEKLLKTVDRVLGGS